MACFIALFFYPPPAGLLCNAVHYQINSEGIGAEYGIG